MTTYTKGLRKCWENFNLKFHHISEAAIAARQQGYDAMLWNGTVYVYCKERSSWIITPFSLSDFEAT